MKQASAFRQSLPLLITSLVNKAGSIGVSLLPMLLVDGHYSTTESSLAMSFVKGSTIAATLLSGFFSDLVGLRVTLLVFLLIAGLGLAFLPVSLGFAILLLSGVSAQLGITSINTTMRLLLTQTVLRKDQKEALGWMRFVNNLGQIFSFGLATMTATLGAKILIWFDALTSFFAFGIGLKILPRKVRKSNLTETETPKQLSVRAQSWWPFLGCALIHTGWTFLYELFMSGVAGKLKVIYPLEGLRIFSLMMVVNTILCALFAVKASKVLSRVVPSLSAAALFTAGGVILGVHSVSFLPFLFLSMLLLTLGEIAYGAFSQFLLIRSVPPTKKENTLYSSAMLVANGGRMLAAGLAFPLIVYSEHPLSVSWISASVGLASLAVLIVGKKEFTKLAE